MLSTFIRVQLILTPLTFGSDENHCSNRLTSSYPWCQCWGTCLLWYPSQPAPSTQPLLTVLISLPRLAEPYTCPPAGSEKVRSADRLKDMPCTEHMAQWACGIKHWVPLSPPLLLQHLGLSVRDTVCQPIHAWPACNVPTPTQNTLVFTETWENPAFLCAMHRSDRGSMQGDVKPANGVKC